MNDQQTDIQPDNPATNSAVAAANWLIERNLRDPSGLSHLKLQKLLYFAQGWHLAILDAPLFGDAVYAWRYGPVVESVYFALRHCGKSEDITEPIRLGYNETPRIAFASVNGARLMDSFWTLYARSEPWKLVAVGNAPGGPWHGAVNSPEARRNPGLNPLITADAMKAYFRGQLAEPKGNAAA